MSAINGFTDVQKTFLQGFAMGSDVSRAVRGLPVLAGSAGASGQTVTVGPPAAGPLPSNPCADHTTALDQQVAAGGKLCAEERAKREKPPEDMWDELVARAAAGEFPKGSDVFLTKFYGMFHVAPAQDSFMCRLRFPGGALRS